MIARLKGIVDTVGTDHAVIDVGGVGYLVFCSARTLSGIGQAGEPVSLQIETHVREDHIHLFGFASGAEKEFFSLLQTVQGVGAKLALQILSAFPVDELRNALAASDVTTITRAPGVGKKLAQRLTTELREKVGAVSLPAGMAASALKPTAAGTFEEATSALVNLGYRRHEAEAAVARAANGAGDDATVETLITAGLKELAR
ncbi:Holliday junction branch migration protein RuvA [Minwuia sp.]|uniref:Holliday junction branch migration protein RuvA n=1 Tax=Minwuia sp. TaxID=2493630 RepID=UPI003A90B81C